MTCNWTPAKPDSDSNQRVRPGALSGLVRKIQVSGRSPFAVHRNRQLRGVLVSLKELTQTRPALNQAGENVGE